jgi:hypothetical protein
VKKKRNTKPAASKLSVLGQLCNLIPPHLVPKLARETDVESMARSFSAWSHVVSMLFAQLTHAIGLNDVCDALRLHSGLLSALRGAAAPSRNNLSHANKRRDAALAEQLFWAVHRDLAILPGTGNDLIATTVPSSGARLTVEAPDSGDSFAAGVVGRAINPTGVPDRFRQTAGVRGINDDGHGVQGQSDSFVGVEGTSNSGTAVFAQSDSGVGVWGVTNSGPFAGFFQGPVQVVGTLTKSGGGFRIDHPLDSANKYMNHSLASLWTKAL